MQLLKRKDTSSNQWKAYKYFEAKNKRLDDEGIEVMFSNALNKMGMMLVIIVNPVNFGQVYLWLQEKSLFGEAALLHNASPGEYLSGGDMVRNLMLAAVANQDLAAQELFYFQYWLKPIEDKVPKSVTEFVYEFVRKFDFNYESKVGFHGIIIIVYLIVKIILTSMRTSGSTYLWPLKIKLRIYLSLYLIKNFPG